MCRSIQSITQKDKIKLHHKNLVQTVDTLIREGLGIKGLILEKITYSSFNKRSNSFTIRAGNKKVTIFRGDK